MTLSPVNSILTNFTKGANNRVELPYGNSPLALGFTYMKITYIFLCLSFYIFLLHCENSSKPTFIQLQGNVYIDSIVPVYNAYVLLHRQKNIDKVLSNKYASKYDADWEISSATFYRFTDENGYFCFEYVLEGDFNLEISLNDSLGKLLPVSITDEQSLVHKDVTNLLQTGSLQGYFFDESLIYLKEINYSFIPDSLGIFVLRGIPVGLYSVYMYAPWDSLFHEIQYQGGKVPIFEDSITIVGFNPIKTLNNNDKRIKSYIRRKIDKKYE